MAPALPRERDGGEHSRADRKQMAIRPAGGVTCATATKSVAARLCLDRPQLGSARSIEFGPAAIPDGIRRQITILLIPFRRSSQPLLEDNAGQVAAQERIASGQEIEVRI